MEYAGKADFIFWAGNLVTFDFDLNIMTCLSKYYLLVAYLMRTFDGTE